MSKELPVGQYVILADEAFAPNTKEISLYKIISTVRLVDGMKYQLQRDADGFVPGRYFTRGQLIPAYESSEKEVKNMPRIECPAPQPPVTNPDNCCTEAPSPYHDKHYNGCIIEPILLMQKHLTKEQFEGFLLGNIIKYRVRAGHKDDAKKDIDKAMRYEQWLREFQEHGTITL